MSKLRQIGGEVKTETKQDWRNLKTQYGKAKEDIRRIQEKKRKVQKSFGKAKKSVAKTGKALGKAYASVDKGFKAGEDYLSDLDHVNLFGEPERKRRKRK